MYIGYMPAPKRDKVFLSLFVPVMFAAIFAAAWFMGPLLTISPGEVAAAHAQPAGSPAAAAAAAAAEDEASGTVHIVEIQNFAFSPASLEVKVGDTITWRNLDAAPHTTTGTEGAWDSGLMTKDAEWSLTVDAAGETSYICNFHPSMKGTVTASE